MNVFEHTYTEYSNVKVRQVVVDHAAQNPERQRFGYYVTATFPDGRESTMQGYVATFEAARHAVYAVSLGIGAILGMVDI